MSKKKSPKSKSAGSEEANKATVAATSPRGGRAGKGGKKAASAKTPREPKAPRASALNAAATVLAGGSKPMSAKGLIAAMEERKLWKSPGGKTPEATLAAAIGREIKTKGKDARFTKEGRGLFGAGQGA
jgi:hypothetical protein